MDLRMPELDGVGAIRGIRSEHPDTHVLVLTTYGSDSDILASIEAGAAGYLLEDTPNDELFRAIRGAAQREAVLAPAITSQLMGRVRAPTDEKLSTREIEVLTLAAQAATNQEIGRALHISEATVKYHLIHIFGGLGVADRTAAVTAALDRGILKLDSG